MKRDRQHALLARELVSAIGHALYRERPLPAELAAADMFMDDVAAAAAERRDRRRYREFWRFRRETTRQ